MWPMWFSEQGELAEGDKRWGIVCFISPRLARVGDFGDLLEQAVEDVVHGRATPEQAMFWAQQEYDKRGQ